MLMITVQITLNILLIPIGFDQRRVMDMIVITSVVGGLVFVLERSSMTTVSSVVVVAFSDS